MRNRIKAWWRRLLADALAMKQRRERRRTVKDFGRLARSGTFIDPKRRPITPKR